MPETIRARVKDTFIQKSDRLFPGDVKTVLIELLQNSRRAGATKIDVKRITGKTQTTIADGRHDHMVALTHLRGMPDWEQFDILWINDDGCGVKDMQSLLEIDTSGWSDSVMKSEDPFGCGFFSLVNFAETVVVVSNGKVVTLHKESFLGQVDVPVKEMDTAFNTPGTLILAVVKSTKLGSVYEFNETVRRTFKFFNTKVILDGEPINNTSYMAGALKTIEFEGVKIGLFSETYSMSEMGLCYHGLIVTPPKVQIYSNPYGWCRNTISTRGWGAGESAKNYYGVRFDVTGDQCQLRLTLPGRSNIVEDEAWQRVRDRAIRFMFEELNARYYGKHRLPYVEYVKVKEWLPDLPEAVPSLKMALFNRQFDRDGSDNSVVAIQWEGELTGRVNLDDLKAEGYFPVLMNGADNDTNDTDVDLFNCILALSWTGYADGGVLATWLDDVGDGLGRYMGEGDGIVLDAPLKVGNRQLVPVMANDAMRGYSWYSAIPELDASQSSVETVGGLNGEIVCDQVNITVDLEIPDGDSEPVIETLSLPVPVALEGYSYASKRPLFRLDKTWLTLKDKAAAVDVVVDIAKAALFEYSMDECQSGTERDDELSEFERPYRVAATAALMGDDDALKVETSGAVTLILDNVREITRAMRKRSKEGVVSVSVLIDPPDGSGDKVVMQIGAEEIYLHGKKFIESASSHGESVDAVS